MMMFSMLVKSVLLNEKNARRETAWKRGEPIHSSDRVEARQGEMTRRSGALPAKKKKKKKFSIILRKRKGKRSAEDVESGEGIHGHASTVSANGGNQWATFETSHCEGVRERRGRHACLPACSHRWPDEWLVGWLVGPRQYRRRCLKRQT